MSDRRQQPEKLTLHPQAEPMTSEQAELYMKEFPGANYLPLNHQPWLCPAIVDFVVACSRALPRVHLHRHIGDGVGIFAEICKLQPGNSAAISNALQKEEKRSVELREAYEHLRKAAKLIGVRPEIFYCIEPPEHRAGRIAQLISSAKSEGLSEDDEIRRNEIVLEQIASMSDSINDHVNGFVPVMEDPPAIEGETKQEHKARAELNRVIRDGTTDIRLSYLRSDYLPHLSLGKTNLEASGVRSAQLNAAAARILWECWPVGIRANYPGVWTPYSLIAEILNWIGFEDVTRDTVRKAVGKAKTDASG